MRGHRAFSPLIGMLFTTLTASATTTGLSTAGLLLLSLLALVATHRRR